MSKRRNSPDSSRRNFLKGATLAGAARADAAGRRQRHAGRAA